MLNVGFHQDETLAVYKTVEGKARRVRLRRALRQPGPVARCCALLHALLCAVLRGVACCALQGSVRICFIGQSGRADARDAHHCVVRGAVSLIKVFRIELGWFVWGGPRSSFLDNGVRIRAWLVRIGVVRRGSFLDNGAQYQGGGVKYVKG